MARIFLLRHAQSVANAKGFLAGRAENIPLSKAGISERVNLNERLLGAKFDQVISSPIQRCLETIQEFHENPEIFEMEIEAVNDAIKLRYPNIETAGEELSKEVFDSILKEIIEISQKYK